MSIEIQIKDSVNPFNSPEELIDSLKEKSLTFDEVQMNKDIEHYENIFDFQDLENRCKKLYHSWMKEDL